MIKVVLNSNCQHVDILRDGVVVERLTRAEITTPGDDAELPRWARRVRRYVIKWRAQNPGATLLQLAQHINNRDIPEEDDL